MIKRISMIVVVLLISGLMITPSQAVVLWYNGDFNGTTGLANGINMGFFSHINVYDDFVVSGEDWLIDTVWSNNLMNFTGVSQALWEIRSVVSIGNWGTLVASSTDTAVQTATGAVYPNYTEYMIMVSGLNISLSPGTYWLTVAPVCNGTVSSYNSTTSGLNAVGEPAGNNDNSFLYSSSNHNFVTNYFGQGFSNFSMGIEGSTGNAPIPEPGTMLLLGTGLVGLVGLRRKKSL